MNAKAIWGERGKVHAALRLLLQERISTAKCLEVLEALAIRREDIDAPWDEVDWNEANDPGVMAQEKARELSLRLFRLEGSRHLKSGFPKPDWTSYGRRTAPDPGADGADPEDDP